jgi:hypothetical protein
VDDSLFKISLPAGCAVSDQIKNKNYTVTTLDTNPPQDAEAI